MNLVKLDCKNHDLNKVSNLIFESDPFWLGLMFGFNKKNVLKKLIKLIKAGYGSFGSENIYILIEKNEIIGILISFLCGSIENKKEKVILKKNLSIFDLLRIKIISTLILKKVVKNKGNSSDYYIKNICIDKNYLRKGFGSFILKSVQNIAKEKKCERIILNISSKNKKAISFFKSNNYKIYDKNSTWFFKKISVYSMEFRI